MSRELIERLRKAHTTAIDYDLPLEAADALQAAAEREEKLRAEVARLGEEYRNAASDNFKFASRIKALEEGLRPFAAWEIASDEPDHWRIFSDEPTSPTIAAFRKARQLLNGDSDA